MEHKEIKLYNITKADCNITVKQHFMENWTSFTEVCEITFNMDLA